MVKCVPCSREFGDDAYGLCIHLVLEHDKLGPVMATAAKLVSERN